MGCGSSKVSQANSKDLPSKPRNEGGGNSVTLHQNGTLDGNLRQQVGSEGGLDEENDHRSKAVRFVSKSNKVRFMDVSAHRYNTAVVTSPTNGLILSKEVSIQCSFIRLFHHSTLILNNIHIFVMSSSVSGVTSFHTYITNHMNKGNGPVHKLWTHPCQ